MSIIKSSLPVFLSLLISSCSHTEPFTKTAKNVDIDRFMIPWYVQVGRFTPFEKDPYNSLESYTWNEKEKRVEIDFSYNEGAYDGPQRKYPQKGRIVDARTNAKWSIQPFWPLRFDYLVLAVDDNYEWAVIGVPNQKYLWIMTKDALYPHEKTNQLIEKVRESGYNVKDLKWVKHNKK